MHSLGEVDNFLERIDDFDRLSCLDGSPPSNRTQVYLRICSGCVHLGSHLIGIYGERHLVNEYFTETKTQEGAKQRVLLPQYTLLCTCHRLEGFVRVHCVLDRNKCFCRIIIKLCLYPVEWKI